MPTAHPQSDRHSLLRRLGLLFLVVFANPTSLPGGEGEGFFEKKIRPVLSEKCVGCHGATKAEGGLRLDSKEHFRQGGDSGDVVELLLEAVRYESLEMPPDGQLEDRVVQDFERWVELETPWPESASIRSLKRITEKDRNWWAFQALKQVNAPETSGDWAVGAIDGFVLKGLDSKGMRPAPRAEAAALLRRLYFAVIGLPPSPEAIEEFCADASPEATRRVVDQLLDDPRYGEHWGRFWLDLVRYSESDGWNQDAYRPRIWQYRDYVVDAFNQDKTYAQFVREQLAGDEIGEDNPEHLVATGFLRLGIYEYNQRDARGHWNDIMNEMTDVAGDVFLGLSMACARCHDHKFDPIPQRDYFRLRAFFEPVVWRDDQVAATKEQLEKHEQDLQQWKAETESLRKQIDALVEPYHAKKWISTVDKFPLDIQACYHMPVEQRTSWQHQMAYLVIRQFEEEAGGPLKNLSKEDKAKHEELKKALAKFDHLKPKPLPAVMTASDFEGLVSPTVIQDDPNRSTVEPGFLEVMEGQDPCVVPDLTNSTGRRTALAKWIGDPANALTHRVIVNRVWQYHFGKGLVDTPSDFGTQGSLATHPELLDWLTRSFIESGGKFKELHRKILLSATWQQSSVHPMAEKYQTLDPNDELLWRAPVHRLRAEQIRDAMLVASGEMESKQGGPSGDEKSKRRSLYLKSFRNKNDRFVDGFDMANGLKSVGVRDTTTTPTQALLLINGSYAKQRAAAMAESLLKDELDPLEVIDSALLRAWGRESTSEERQCASEFLQVAVGGEERKEIDASRLSDFCHVLFNSNQFLYLE